MSENDQNRLHELKELLAETEKQLETYMTHDIQNY